MVYVPMGPGLTWNVIESLRPGLWEMRYYSGPTVERQPGEVVVVFTNDEGPKGHLAGQDNDDASESHLCPWVAHVGL